MVIQRTDNTMVKSLKIPQRITRSRKSKDRQHNGQKFEDTTEDNQKS